MTSGWPEQSLRYGVMGFRATGFSLYNVAWLILLSANNLIWPFLSNQMISTHLRPNDRLTLTDLHKPFPITIALQEQLMAIKPKKWLYWILFISCQKPEKMPRGRIKSLPRFFARKEGKKNQYREAANLNRANTQGDIYPFANTMVFQNVTRASESLRPLRRKKYVHDTLRHNARYIRTQTKWINSIQHSSSGLDVQESD